MLKFEPHLELTPISKVAKDEFDWLHELLDIGCNFEEIDSALVFRVSSEKLERGDKYDLLATPESIADTWGPARFITDLGSMDLRAIEIGGVIITCIAEDPDKFHWSAGQAFNDAKQAFNSKDKILIGGTTLNPQCPLDETKLVPSIDKCIFEAFGNT